MQDTFGRIWSCGTIQLDFIQPQNFNLCCVNELGEKEEVVVIHQAMFGSLERFMAICLEHHKGKLPLWMSSVQVRVIAMTNEQIKYAEIITNHLLIKGIRVIFDPNDSDPLRAKLQRSIKNYEYFSVILGKKEQETNTISVRYNYSNVQKNNITINEFMDLFEY